MRNQLLAAAGVFAVAALAAGPVAGQTSPAAAKTPAAKPAATKAWTTPKTPWGHPDISGTWTSDGAIGIPLARPDQFAGRVELTETRVRRQAEARRGDAEAVGRPLRRVLRRQRVAQEVVQPDVADRRWRRQDAAADAAGRIAPGPARPRHVRQRAVREPDGFHELRSLHHARHRRIGPAGRLRQRQPDRADAERSGDQLRDGARHAHHSARWTAPRRLEDPAVHGRRARTLGRRYAGRRDHEPHRSDQHRPERQRPASQRRHEDRGAVHAQGAGRAAVRDPHRRSEDLHAAVHDQDPADFAAGIPAAARTTATKATTCWRPCLAASAPRTRRSRKTRRRGSSARASRCRPTSTPRPARPPAKAGRPRARELRPVKVGHRRSVKKVQEVRKLEVRSSWKRGRELRFPALFC